MVLVKQMWLKIVLLFLRLTRRRRTRNQSISLLSLLSLRRTRRNGKKKVEKDKCYFCGKAGHFKKDCRNYLAKKGQGNGNLYFIESYLIDDSNDPWFVDYEATNHVYVSL